MDAVKNFCKSIIPLGYSAGAVSIVLTAGNGVKFPAAPFNIVWWNATDYPDPSDDPLVEICRVTLVVGDTFTISRAQEGTIASAKNIAGKLYRILAGLTASMLTNQISPDQYFQGGNGPPGGLVAPVYATYLDRTSRISYVQFDIPSGSNWI